MRCALHALPDLAPRRAQRAGGTHGARLAMRGFKRRYAVWDAAWRRSGCTPGLAPSTPTPPPTTLAHAHTYPPTHPSQVVCTEETVAAAERARSEGRPPWRVSSTVFSQITSDVVLQPLGPFAAAPGAAAYPPTPAGAQVADELAMINLKN